MTQITDVMSTAVESIEPDATPQRAAMWMKTPDVGSLPMCVAGQLLGMVTDRDIGYAASPAACGPSRPVSPT